jgi:hypothetical protein
MIAQAMLEKGALDGMAAGLAEVRVMRGISPATSARSSSSGWS